MPKCRLCVGYWLFGMDPRHGSETCGSRTGEGDAFWFCYLSDSIPTTRRRGDDDGLAGFKNRLIAATKLFDSS